MAGFRRDRISRPIHRLAKRALPQLSETEAEALGAGEVWWDAELFSGNPDWRMLHSTAAPKLSGEEQAFIEGPCRQLCGLIDDWRLNQHDPDLSPEVWQLMRQHRFFGMIIGKKYGGLGFSAFAHSEVVRFIATRSVAAAATRTPTS